MLIARHRQKGFSLVEAMVGLSVMALVITGGLIALGQATLISEKNSNQLLADVVLRSEIENLRASTWSEILTHHNLILKDTGGQATSSFPELISLDKKLLEDMGLSAEVRSAQLNSSGETGKIAFRILLTWADTSGRRHEEARVLVVTEGGFSARR